MKNPVVWRTLVVVGACLPFVGAQHAAPLQSAMPGPALTRQDSAFHALNRLAYGPRPGDVPRVAAEGVMRWIDRQLSPDAIDDQRLAERQRQFQILEYDRGDLAAMYTAAERQRRGRETGPPPPPQGRQGSPKPDPPTGHGPPGPRSQPAGGRGAPF